MVHYEDTFEGEGQNNAFSLLIDTRVASTFAFTWVVWWITANSIVTDENGSLHGQRVR